MMNQVLRFLWFLTVYYSLFNTINCLAKVTLHQTGNQVYRYYSSENELNEKNASALVKQVNQSGLQMFFKRLHRRRNHNTSEDDESNARDKRETTTTPRSLDPKDFPKEIDILKDPEVEIPISHSPQSPIIYKVEYITASVDGFRLEPFDKKGVGYEDSGASVVLANDPTSIRLFGKGFTNFTVVRFSTQLKARGAVCDDASDTNSFTVSHINQNTLASALVENVLFPKSRSGEYYYVCVRESDKEMPWIHQGPDAWLTIVAYKRLLPFWVQAVFIVVLLLLSGLFAGLTLGLLALDRTDLRILANTGSESERVYAKTILPLRTKGNYLLCSLVLGNVLVNSTLTILLDGLTSGVIAVLCSTAGIVIVGEIIPQAVCSRHGLAIGAKTVWVTKFLMILTLPLSYTISVILDKILGEEIGIVYNREKLKELIALTMEHNDLEAHEVNIISGALSMKKKTVDNIMTPLEDIFMLPIDGLMNLETLSEIRKQGFSRIPIYEGERRNIVSILSTKDLVVVDPEDSLVLKGLVEFYSNKCFFLLAETTLDVVFREFRESNRGHIAFIQRINKGHEQQDPYYETVGLVTLEDVVSYLLF